MKSYSLLLVPVVLASLLYSCKKNDEGERNTVVVGQYTSLQDAINKYAPPSKTVSVAVSQGGDIFSGRGTRFIIPKNCFETQAGVQVTGSVQVTVNDWILKGDMTFGKVLPTSYDQPLNSAGEGYIHVTQNGQVLRMRPGMRIQVNFPQYNKPVSGASGYIGDQLLQGSQNTINWLPVDTNTIKLGTAGDSVVIYSTALEYLSAAATISTSRKEDFRLILKNPPQVTLENTMAVAIFDNTKTVIGIPSAINNEVHVVTYPSGTPSHFAVMGINNGRFYGGIAAVANPMSDSTDTVIIKQIEPPTFKITLNSL